MDVRCARCGTEYDFDDALVSERGTTVKCTNCAHQFKVYPGGGAGGPERWIVRKSSGRELVYTSLRDLQRAIAQRQVGPTDLLSRGGEHPMRQLGAIAELEPFFHNQPAAANPVPAQQRTLLGMTPAAKQQEDTVPEEQRFQAPPPSSTSVPTGRSNYTHTPAGGFAPLSKGNAPSARGQQALPAENELSTEPHTHLPEEEPEPATLGSQIAQRGALGSDGPPGASRSASVRPPFDSFSDEPLPSLPVPRHSALRWVVGLVVAGALAFVGGTVGIRYLKKLSPQQASSASAPNDRVRKLLSDGDSDLSRGDFESAKEKFDKASALAEHDPKVLSALARLEAARADEPWLALRLIDPKNTSELDAERAELDGRIARVKKAAELAAAAKDSEPAVVRARIDALRLSGDVAQARQLVSTIGASASDPETAYVLAALDMAEPTPVWTTIVDRLRTAVSTERGFGRAHGALVYALASSGAFDEARAELSKADSAGPPNRLSGRLKTFLQRVAPPLPSAAAAVPVPSGAVPSVSGAPAASASLRTAGGTGEAPPPQGNDFRKLLEDASAAKKSGDMARAEALYRAAQQQEPGNVEALAGLADIERARGDLTAALGHYEAVLQQNPTYLPALVAAADIKWQRGDRTGALALYKRVVTQSDPGSPFGQKAAARIAEAAKGSSGGGSTPTPAETSTPKPKPTTDTPGPVETPSNIDTSDLPGMK